MVTLSGKQITKAVDTEVHPFVMPANVSAYLRLRWRTKFEMYGIRPVVHGSACTGNSGYRRGTWPDTFFGDDVDPVKEQLLGRYNLAAAVLMPAHVHSFGAEQAKFSDVLCRGLNDLLTDRFPPRVLTYSINYPHRFDGAARQLLGKLDEEDRDRVLSGNTVEHYRRLAAADGA